MRDAGGAGRRTCGSRQHHIPAPQGRLMAMTELGPECVSRCSRSFSCCPESAKGDGGGAFRPVRDRRHGRPCTMYRRVILFSGQSLTQQRQMSKWRECMMKTLEVKLRSKGKKQPGNLAYDLTRRRYEPKHTLTFIRPSLQSAGLWQVDELWLPLSTPAKYPASTQRSHYSHRKTLYRHRRASERQKDE